MPSSKADVVPLSAHEVLSRLSDEVKKWSGWKINFRLWLHILHHIPQEKIEGLIAGTHKIVAVKIPEVVRTLKKLAHKVTTTVSAMSGVDKDKLYGGKLGFKVWTSAAYDNIVKKNLPGTISCDEHRINVFHLTENMLDSQIQGELKPSSYRPVAEVGASQLSRIMMWSRGEAGHELLTNGYANIDYGVAEDGRVVVVLCNFGEDAREWDFHCRGLDGLGDWDAGRQVSVPALGA